MIQCYKAKSLAFILALQKGNWDMGKYLGKISIVNDYVNFMPLYALRENDFVQLTEKDRKTLLPESALGDINLYDSSQYYKDVKKQFHDQELCFFEFVTESLEDNMRTVTNERNRTGYKVDIGKLPKDAIETMDDHHLFYVISETLVEEDENKPSILLIKDPQVFQGMDVVIRVQDMPNLVLGPFEVEVRDVDQEFYLNTKKEQQKYMIKACKYPSEKIKHCVHQFDASEQLRFDQLEWIYIQVTDSVCESVWYDGITEKVLLKDFIRTLNAGYTTGKLDFSEIDNAVQFYTKSILTGNLPADICTHRQDMLKAVLQATFKNEEQLQELLSPIIEMVKAHLLDNDDSFSSVAFELTKDPSFMNKIQRNAIISNKIKEKEDELESLDHEINQDKRELEDLKEQKKELESQRYEELMGQYNDDITAKIDELNQYEEKVANLKDTHERLKTIDNLEYEIYHLERNRNDVQAEIEQQKRQMEELKGKLDTYFKDETDKALRFAFDGMLSSRMLAQAAEWEAQQKATDYTTAFSKVRATPPTSMAKEELKNYLCEQIKEYRPDYSPNFILNLVICYTQGFLTIFSGEPGTGKTSICDILAHVLGLSQDESNAKGVNLERYIRIPVEKGWTSKRDLIGYYNPLTKQFDRNNRKLFDSLNLLNNECGETTSDRPFVILLDEANLSPMEHYWSDFLGICDNLHDTPPISLGEDYSFHIPKFLRFVATINNDHTTENLSPRVVDRAWVVHLPAAKRGTAKPLELKKENVPSISWNSLCAAFSPISNTEIIIPTDSVKIYNEVLDHFDEMKIPFSPRSDNAIRRYLSVAQEELSDEDEFGLNIDKSIVALDFALAQRLLPKINGYGEEFKTQVESLQSLCNSRNLHNCRAILDDILRKGEKNMMYYQYFA